MSDDKGKLPPDSSPAEIDEGWDALDEAIAAATAPPAASPAAPPAVPDPAPPPSSVAPSPPLPSAPRDADPEPEVLSLKDRHKTDQDHPALSSEDLASEEAEEEWDVAVPTAKHLPRDLPKAPPGERRVARTIMGVGTPEIQAAIKERLARKAAEPAPAASTRPLTPPAASTHPATPAKAPVTPTGPSREPARPASPALAETNKVPALASGSDEIPPISALASTAPLASVGPTPPPPAEIPFAHTSPAIEPLTVRMRPGGPAVTPTAGTRRTQPERRTGQGPSNLALILLWSVALISVGLALYLYFARG